MAANKSSRRGLLHQLSVPTHPRIDTNGDNHWSYHSAFMLVLLISSTGMALAMLPALVSSSKYNPEQISKNIQSVTQPMHALISILMCIICLVFIIRKKVWTLSEKVVFLKDHQLESSDNINNDMNQQHTGNSEVASHRVPHLQIVVFGIGCGLWLLLNIMYIGTHEPGHYSYVSIIRILDSGVYLILVLVQIVFFLWYDGAIFPNHRVFHYIFALMIADKIWVWLLVTLRHYVKLSAATPNSTHSHDSHGNKTDIYQVTVHISMLFLEPIFLEYLNMSVCVLFNLWTLIGHSYCRRQRIFGRHSNNLEDDYRDEDRCEFDQRDTRRHQTTDDSSDAESEQARLLTVRVRAQGVSKNQKLYVVIYMFILIVAGVGFLFTNLLLTLEQFEYLKLFGDGSEIPNVIYRAIQAAIFLPFMILCKLAIHQLNKRTQVSAVVKTDALLLFTSATNYIWFILRFIATTSIIFSKPGKMDTQTTPSLFELILYNILQLCCILQIWLQTQLLLTAHNSRKSDHSKMTRWCLMYLIVINISVWLQMAISRENTIEKASSLNPRMNQVFGEINTRKMTYILSPVMELYHFHSAVMAYEMLRQP
ncbi:uncharacterized protein [Amphiura filiformis]|uniref:uncharacterized protein n=1 Tax=Amphiura filiformis TaxID=82378 RepID=UPI003B22294A